MVSSKIHAKSCLTPLRLLQEGVVTALEPETAASAMKNEWRVMLGVCAVVVGIYAYTAHDGHVTQSSLDAATSNYYNLLVQGFRDGQLNLKKKAPPGLAQLADPYTPTPLHALGAWDLSYYRGKLYLYFGVSPAVVLFWPYVALTGHYLFYRQAMTMFCAVGFLASMGILVGLRRRYFAEVSMAVVAAGGLALGLATFIPSLVARCEVWEVPISCGYMLTMLALGAIWCTFHEPERGWRWLAAASAAYGLAVGARPSLASGAIILVVPVAQAWQERRKIWALLLAATGPIILIGFGLMLYNVGRFDDPFEFGIHYQITVRSQIHEQLFSLHNFWLHVRAYFLETAQWRGHFPFVQRAEDNHAFGVLTNIPLAWLALAVPLAWRGRVGPAGSVLRWFVITVAVLFGMCALTLGLYYFVALRYEVEILPALVLLAVIGIWSLERALACQPFWRRVARWGYGLLLAFSVAFNLFASVERCAEADNELGILVQGAGRVPEAIGHYEQALRLNPDFADAHRNLGNALMQTGRTQEAIGHYEQALRIRPDFFEAHSNLGNALLQSGQDSGGHRTVQTGVATQPRFCRRTLQSGKCLLAGGEDRGSHRPVPAGPADQARFGRGAQQPRGRVVSDLAA